MYKTIILDAQKTKKMSAAIEEKANEMEQIGWELAAFSVTESGKAVLAFKTDKSFEINEDIEISENAGELE